jgi:hypothetical protein
MSTLVTRPTSRHKAIDPQVCDVVLVDPEVNKKKKAAAGKTIDPSVVMKDVDIRDWAFGDRKLLTDKSTRIPIYIGDKRITTISKPLLRATSEITFDIVKDGAIKLPAKVDKDGVTRLVDHLEAMTKFALPPRKINYNLSMVAALGVCSAAEHLGMRKYADHLYKKCEALLRKDPPAYDNITAILACKDQHPRIARLWRLIVVGLAVHVWDRGSLTQRPLPSTFLSTLSSIRPSPTPTSAARKSSSARTSKRLMTVRCGRLKPRRRLRSSAPARTG